MVMIHCRECGDKISESAPTCPKCGAKQKGFRGENKKKKLNATLWAFF